VDNTGRDIIDGGWTERDDVAKERAPSHSVPRASHSVWSTGRRSHTKAGHEARLKPAWSSRVVGHWLQEARAKPASTSLVAARRPARRHQVKRCSALACEPHTLAPHVPSLPCLRHNGHHLRLPHPHWPSPICTSSLDGPPSIATFRTFSQPPILLLPLLLHDQQFQFIRVLFLSSYSEQIITCISEKL